MAPTFRNILGRHNRARELRKPRWVAAAAMLGWGALTGLLLFIAWLIGSFWPFPVLAAMGPGYATYNRFAKAWGMRDATVQGNYYGDAAHATLEDTGAAEMLERLRFDPRPYLGWQNIVWRDKNGDLQRRHTDNIVRVGKDGYETSAFVVGHSGIGKTLGLGVPNMMAYRSMLVIDPDGQIAAMTAAKRQAMGFGKSIILNPLGVLGLESVGFNPLYDVPAPTNGQNEEADDAFVTKCTVLGSAGIHTSFREWDAHWSLSARELNIGLHMVECVEKDPKNRSYRNIRKAIAGGAEEIHRIATRIIGKFPEIDDKLAKYTKEITPELNSIISHLQTQTSWASDKRYIRDLEAPGGRVFEWSDLKKNPMTIFLVLPADELAADAGGRWWLRLMVSIAVSEVLQAPNVPGQRPVLMMLDEFPHLGYLPSIANAVNLVRKHNLAFWFFSQDIGLASSTYGSSWPSIESACATKICYRSRDLDTARHFSELTGRRTEVMRTENMHHDIDRDTYGNSAEGFPLYMPQDIGALPPKTAIVISSDVPNRTIEVRTPGIYEREMAPWMRGMDPDPYGPG